MKRKGIKKGDVVVIRHEWQDAGDGDYVWLALEDEDGGRVKIQPQIPGMTILPVNVVKVAWLIRIGLRGVVLGP